MDARQGRAVEACCRQALQARRMRLLAAERADVERLRAQRALERGIVELGIVGQRDDSAALVEPDRVLFSGDVSMKALPAVGGQSKLTQWLTSQDTFAALKPLKVVPSHGPLGDASLIATNKTFLTTVQKRAAELKAAGKTVDDTVTTLQAELGPTYGTSPRLAGTVRSAYAQAP